MKEKRRLRREILARRDGMDPREREDKSRIICENLFGLDCMSNPAAALFFSTMKTEVDTSSMIDRALRLGIAVALPRMAGEGRLELRAVTDPEADTSPNSMGIPEPLDHCPEKDPSAFSVIIVPGVAFDPLGYRVGYGGGYYDRLLKSAPRAERVALAFDIQVVHSVPRMGHDLAVDVLVTESGAKRFYRRIVCPISA